MHTTQEAKMEGQTITTASGRVQPRYWAEQTDGYTNGWTVFDGLGGHARPMYAEGLSGLYEHEAVAQARQLNQGKA